MLNRKTCKKVFCATYTDIQLFCREMTITKQPEKILLHCGCNDIDRNKKDKPNIFGDIDETLKILQKLFPKSKLIISTLFPGGERDLINMMNDINNHLINISLNTPLILVMDNKRIGESMLSDNKQMNKIRFFIFLANIRFIMFGILPKLTAHSSLTFNERSASYSNRRNKNRY